VQAGGQKETVKMKRILTILAMILVAQTATAQDYRVRAGDVLQIEVLEDPSLNRTAIVLPDGKFAFPLVGTVRAGGLSLNSIKAALADGLSSNFAASPTVFVGLAQLGERVAKGGPAAPATSDIYVLGEVGNPGKLSVDQGTTILQLFAEMGGFTKFAAKKRVQVRRNLSGGAQQLIMVDYHSLERGAELQNDIVLQDGDTVIVPQRRLFE
jgi:polysaccharide export outer membrane protein